MTALDEPINTLNPRFQTPMVKQPAPIQLRAFLAAFKQLNAGWYLSV
jgi:hypothetical protein